MADLTFSLNMDDTPMDEQCLLACAIPGTDNQCRVLATQVWFDDRDGDVFAPKTAGWRCDVTGSRVTEWATPYAWALAPALPEFPG